MTSAPTDKEAASICFEKIELEEDKYRLGHTKLFFRTGVVAFLEELREEKIQFMMKSVQVWKNEWKIHKNWLKFPKEKGNVFQHHCQL